MKKILISFLLFISFLTLKAQNWADSGAVWHYGFGGIITQGYVEIEYTQDTLILGVVSKELKRAKSGINFLYGDFFEFVMGYEYTYSDSDHVYVLHNGQFEILYDFSAEVGDTLTHYLPNDYYNPFCDSIGRSVVSAIGTEVINSEELRWYELDYVDGISGFSSYYNRVYEKLGSMSYMFPTNDICGLDDDYYSPFRCYEDDDFGMYQNPEYVGECEFVYEFPIPNYFHNDPEWCMESSQSYTGCHTNRDYVYYLDGSNSIDGNLYWNLYERGVGITQENIPGEGYDCYNVFTFNNFLGLLRQDGEIIYFTPSDDMENEELLFDFSLNIGDTIPQSLSFDYYPIGYAVVSDIDSIYMYDNYYKRIYFETQFESIYEVDFYMEGIGHRDGLITPYGLDFEHLFWVRAYRKGEIPYYQFPNGGECNFALSIDELYSKSLTIHVYPNPAKDLLTVETIESSLIEVLKIYSISGTLVKEIVVTKNSISDVDVSNLESGMYFIEITTENGDRGVKRFVKE